ncbi:MAG: YceI family protein [Candidatus Paceibacterota bacterium]
MVETEESKVNWAGKKPLIDGYVNKGFLAVSDGQIEITGEEVSGNFTIDMNTLSVSDTPTKPGRESALEGHLKGEGWFNVGQFPEASFVITQAEMSNSGGNYLVTGDLTMKGVTNEISFPASVYLDEAGSLVAEANFEFDRTKWGITSGSGSIFDNLADNVIDDMVALSFVLVANKQ